MTEHERHGRCERCFDDGVDIAIEAVRSVVTPEQRHAVEQIVTRVLAHPGAETPRERPARRDELDDA